MHTIPHTSYLFSYWQLVANLESLIATVYRIMYVLWTCLPEDSPKCTTATHTEAVHRQGVFLGVLHVCLWPLKAPRYLGGGWSSLLSALWHQYSHTSNDQHNKLNVRYMWKLITADFYKVAVNQWLKWWTMNKAIWTVLFSGDLYITGMAGSQNCSKKSSRTHKHIQISFHSQVIQSNWILLANLILFAAVDDTAILIFHSVLWHCRLSDMKNNQLAKNPTPAKFLRSSGGGGSGGRSTSSSCSSSSSSSRSSLILVDGC